MVKNQITLIKIICNCSRRTFEHVFGDFQIEKVHIAMETNNKEDFLENLKPKTWHLINSWLRRKKNSNLFNKTVIWKAKEKYFVNSSIFFTFQFSIDANLTDGSCWSRENFETHMKKNVKSLEITNWKSILLKYKVI